MNNNIKTIYIINAHGTTQYFKYDKLDLNKLHD